MLAYCSLVSSKRTNAWRDKEQSSRNGGTTCRRRLCFRKQPHFGVATPRVAVLSRKLNLLAALLSSAKAASFPEDPDPEVGKIREVALGDILPGDYVVHRIHGVGRYLGLELLWRRVLRANGDPGASLQEYIVLQFADGILRVPADQVDCMTRLQSGSVAADDDDIDDDFEEEEEVASGRKSSKNGTKTSRRPMRRSPRLDALSRARHWEQRRNRAAKVVQKAAIDILRIEALRISMRRPRYTFDPNDPRYVAFDEAFEYNKTGGLTSDQRECIKDIFSDLCDKETPMDRLVCGDVGVGKTEVAMRAIFLAILNNRQVAVLAPTTTLVSQHMRTLRRRMPDFIRIGALYRDVTPKEARDLLEELASGKIDILVGTHALLGERVSFYLRPRERYRLGTGSSQSPHLNGSTNDTHDKEQWSSPPRDGLLLVIDEEQRFGVSQKEKIKILDYTKAAHAEDVAVDVLTLSATPIPRTLYMALSGIRDVSMIHRPPARRLPVRTFILAHSIKSESVVDKAIAHELRRGGQVFYVVPRIADIPDAYKRVSAALTRMNMNPETYPILIGHSRSSRLEETMLSFASGEGRILISTTIVENGLDIPTAGTIIVANAQKFGLAQLYQLRGRVGRCANLQAYCLYVFEPKAVVNNPDAQLRLQALRELTQDPFAFGRKPRSVGLQIAQRDLEIRGAGDLLGASQSGMNWDLGPELFAKMLREATEDLRRQQGLLADASETGDQLQLQSFRKYVCNCEFALNGLTPSIPRTIVPDPVERAQVYRNLSSVRSESEIDAEFEAVLGGRSPPKSLIHFILMMKSKFYARQLAIERIYVDAGDILLQSPAPYQAWSLVLERVTTKREEHVAPPILGANRVLCRECITTTQIVLRNIGKLSVERQLELVLDLLRCCSRITSERAFHHTWQNVSP
jgi:transcription-repair coupling factor (superfamily II helicase)